jgi:hypothetical protein
MSYINASLWNNIQVSDATNEKRFSELGIVDAVKESTPFVVTFRQVQKHSWQVQVL